MSTSRGLGECCQPPECYRKALDVVFEAQNHKDGPEDLFTNGLPDGLRRNWSIVRSLRNAWYDPVHKNVQSLQRIGLEPLAWKESYWVRAKHANSKLKEGPCSRRRDTYIDRSQWKILRPVSIALGPRFKRLAWKRGHSFTKAEMTTGLFCSHHLTKKGSVRDAH